MNLAGVRAVISMRRRTRLLYYRFDPGLVGVVSLARILGYRPVAEMNNLMFGRDYPDRGRGLRASLVDRAKVTAMRLATHVTLGFVAVTDRIKDILVSSYGVPAAHVLVLANGVDVERFRPQDRDAAATQLGLDPDCRHVLFVGLMAEWVDFPSMLGAFATVAATRPDARFVIVGDGPESGHVDQLIRELGIGDRIVRTGPVADRERVSLYMAAASVCIVAYHGAMLRRIGGGSPMKVLEYMAAGRAVLTTRTEGLADVVGSTGSGVAVADPSAMALALGELLDDRDRADRLGLIGREAAVNRFSWAPVVAQTLALLDPPA
jgi:glycosyltransferase involved in cell wall biosynthesis